MLKTKIVCTIGPASESEEMLTKLVNTGMNVARINFSHGGYEENATKIDTIKKVRETLNQPIPLCLDTKGPEIRTGKLESGDVKVKIEEGQKFTFLYEDVIGNNTKASISYKGLSEDVKPGSTILVDDGFYKLIVTSKDDNGFDKVREEFFTLILRGSEEDAKKYILNKYPRMMPYINGYE